MFLLEIRCVSLFVLLTIGFSVNSEIYSYQELLGLKDRVENTSAQKFKELQYLTERLTNDVNSEQEKNTLESLPGKNNVIGTEMPVSIGFKITKTRHFWGKTPKRKFQDYIITYDQHNQNHAKSLSEFMRKMTIEGWSMDLNRIAYDMKTNQTKYEMRFINYSI